MCFGKRQMSILFQLYTSNAIRQFVVTPRKIGYLVDKMFVNSSFHGCGANKNAGSTKQTRHSAKASTTNGPN